MRGGGRDPAEGVTMLPAVSSDRLPTKKDGSVSPAKRELKHLRMS